ncbi:hypothetical protein IW140_004504 [Coemansia sp. RSA 1813]|nr:hypothetical protein EV178_004682 [Coemansia sp. RSA 1646]KAJ1771166.1 hypothetical protein LPJ74_002555 [Coemansia sp. RSA 1843]KAJ2087810.1 hypothetical protein IW138_004705 [Coemansia sp. RSA 986]KAJ2212704.1 hypothetical protein EV179_004452 [Coemansia sp. RSA 487]KAJ2567371.1 hypothetical protein IW140_004504 [Coemansia sp. RSA 1813]
MDQNADDQRETKRPRIYNNKQRGKAVNKQPIEDTTNTSITKQAILSSFKSYRDTLDAHYDQRERVIKCSRDITALSKKIVFTLLRITQDGQTQVFDEAERKHKQVVELFVKISSDLRGTDAYKYNGQATHGIQEYIEALGLWTFLKDNRLITREQVLERLTPEGAQEPLVNVTESDYVLGICDLPGEVNRFCINSIGKGDREAVKRCVAFLRVMKEGVALLLCSGKIKDLDKKFEVLDSSLSKTEAAYYSMSIREGEMSAMDVDAPPPPSSGNQAVAAAE